MAWERVLGTFVAGILPMLPQLSLIFLAVLALTCPIPGRGPRLFQRLDPWRLFKGEARRAVMRVDDGRMLGRWRRGGFQRSSQRRVILGG
jgi:hypothetical protein